MCLSSLLIDLLCRLAAFALAMIAPYKIRRKNTVDTSLCGLIIYGVTAIFDRIRRRPKMHGNLVEMSRVRCTAALRARSLRALPHSHLPRARHAVFIAIKFPSRTRCEARAFGSSASRNTRGLSYTRVYRKNVSLNHPAYLRTGESCRARAAVSSQNYVIINARRPRRRSNSDLINSTKVCVYRSFVANERNYKRARVSRNFDWPRAAAICGSIRIRD